MRTFLSARRAGLLTLLAALAALLCIAPGAGAVTGAGFTTVNEGVDEPGHCQNGNPNNNCNIYDGKQYVWLNGGPSTAYVGDGSYFFAVLAPGGQPDPNDGSSAKNLSDDVDTYENRIFTVTSGTVSYTGSHDFDGNKIRLSDYADTPNPGGVYILAICSLANDYPVTPSSCKYDAFKVNSGEDVTPAATDPTITKDAAGAYDTTWTWGIQKSVDKTVVKQMGGTATFSYTVTVTHDGGSDSAIKVKGTITVLNANVDSSFATVPIDIDGVTDQLSDGTVCEVTDGGPQTLTTFKTDFPYECTLSGLPQGGLDNTAEVAWPGQLLDNGALLQANSKNITFSGIQFAENKVDNCADVTDTYAGSLGTVCASDPSPMLFKYSRTVPVPQWNCTEYGNTATFTTNTTGATGSASQAVNVCGPAKTGGLTIGFWQNKNGQGIISEQAKTGVCPSATWLRQFAPFQDLSATASCGQVATYVSNVIKAANASGASMNAMLKAQMLATALDVYFSDGALGGNKIGAPAPIGGVAIDLTKVGGSYQDVSSAFGGATALTVAQMLSYAASQSNVGGSTWYANVKAKQELAKNAFDAINNQVVFGA